MIQTKGITVFRGFLATLILAGLLLLPLVSIVTLAGCTGENSGVGEAPKEVAPPPKPGDPNYGSSNDIFKQPDSKIQ